MEIIIREAEARDTDRLDEMLTLLIRYESQFDSNLNQNCIITTNYHNRIGLDGHKLLVAEKDGEIIGYLYGFIHQIPDVLVQPIAVLDALFVEENFRQMGCASKLFLKFKDFAIENGACRIELKVISNNIKAMELYQKFSFKEAKKYMNLDLIIS